ncbi:MAG: hypothetical protein H7123_07240, partial [Thermoleophilia bacterium]|nr:hypothetical protein [Thermoleophilia bacterium]
MNAPDPTTDEPTTVHDAHGAPAPLHQPDIADVEHPRDHDHLIDDDFGCASPEETLEATRSGAACAWWQLTGFISVQGPDTITFLDAIASQDIAAIPGGSGRHALFLTPKARIIAPVLVWRVAEDHVLLELDPRVIDVLQSHLRRYKLRAKVEILPLELGCTSLVGHGAEALAVRLANELGAMPPAHTEAIVAATARASSDDDDAVSDNASTNDPFEHGGWYSSPAWGLPARTFIGSLAATHAVVSLVETRELTPMADPETLDALRITAGVPAL